MLSDISRKMCKLRTVVKWNMRRNIPEVLTAKGQENS